MWSKGFNNIKSKGENIENNIIDVLRLRHIINRYVKHLILFFYPPLKDFQILI